VSKSGITLVRPRLIAGSGAEFIDLGILFTSNVTDPQMHQCQKCTTICLAFLMRLHIMIFYCFYTSTGQF
jgi:hypothetical protein